MNLFTLFARWRQSRWSGMTVAEFLVVAGIIGLLALLAFFSYNSAKEKTRDAARLKGVNDIQSALERYYADNSTYPSAVSSGGSIGNYLPVVPADPGQSQYVYSIVDNGVSYTLEYWLETNFAGLSAGRHVAAPGELSSDQK